jgi:hypothetical protein
MSNGVRTIHSVLEETSDKRAQVKGTEYRPFDQLFEAWTFRFEIRTVGATNSFIQTVTGYPLLVCGSA